MKADFHEYLDALFCSQAPSKPAAGEDSFCSLLEENAALVAVFDGCGGLGFVPYPGFQGHTGAWVASRLACGAAHDWFRACHAENWQSSEEMTASLNLWLKKGLEKGPVYGNSLLAIGGSMVRDFPCTIALALVRLEEEQPVLYLAWAGDSRVYLLDRRGLAQLTADDSEESDAFDNLSNDGELTNLLSSDGNYTLHHKRLPLDSREPQLIFAATDGCFGYIPSPMEFEYTICRSILEVKSVNTLRSNLRETFKKTAGDDFSFACMSFFAGSYEGIQQLAALRVQALEETILPRLYADRAAARELWQDYRRDYERYL